MFRIPGINPGINPWLAMWDQPRSTIRAVIHHRPSYGVFWLTALFALQSFFFYANWWSLGLKVPCAGLLLLGLLFAPLAGLLWLRLVGYLFYWPGRLLNGRASLPHLRTAIAWSKIPGSVALLMWLAFLLVAPESTFIQDGGGPPSLLINFITLTFGAWSSLLTLQSLREVQQFSLVRSLLNLLLGLLLASLFFLLLFMLIRKVTL